MKISRGEKKPKLLNLKTKSSIVYLGLAIEKWVTKRNILCISYSVKLATKITKSV